MVKLVIFDMDGLMFDTERATCRAYMEKAAAWGYKPTMEQYLQFLGLNGKQIQQKYYEFFEKDMDAEKLYSQVCERKMEILRAEGIPVKEGLLPLLDVLDEMQIKKAVASGSSMESIRENLESAGLEERFDLLMSTDLIARGKPFPDIFLEICRRLHIKPQEALVLEDGLNGVQAAIAGNISVINIPDMIPLREDIAKQCAAVKESLLDVIPIIRSLG